MGLRTVEERRKMEETGRISRDESVYVEKILYISICDVSISCEPMREGSGEGGEKSQNTWLD